MFPGWETPATSHLLASSVHLIQKLLLGCLAVCLAPNWLRIPSCLLDPLPMQRWVGY